MHLNVNEIKKLLRKWHYYTACISNQGDSLLKWKLEEIERAVSQLDDISCQAITMHYFNGATIEMTAAHVFLTVRGTYYRISSAIKEMEYLINNRVS